MIRRVRQWLHIATLAVLAIDAILIVAAVVLGETDVLLWTSSPGDATTYMPGVLAAAIGGYSALAAVLICAGGLHRPRSQVRNRT